MSTVAYPHIEIRENGRAYIAGTGFKVRQLVLDHIAWGWTADEIRRQHPPLTLGQIHAALSYYYDHQETMDREIEEGQKLVEHLRAQQDPSNLAFKARAIGRELP